MGRGRHHRQRRRPPDRLLAGAVSTLGVAAASDGSSRLCLAAPESAQGAPFVDRSRRLSARKLSPARRSHHPHSPLGAGSSPRPRPKPRLGPPPPISPPHQPGPPPPHHTPTL